MPMTCFLDLDGVLADYYGGVCRLFGVDPWPYKCRLGDWDFFHGDPMNKADDDVAPLMGHGFYASLGKLTDADLVVSMAEGLYADRVFILTSPWDTHGCHAGKVAWVKEHYPKYARRMMIGSPKEAVAHRDAVLIDDSPVNCERFRSGPHGGEAFLYPRPWNDRFAEADPATGSALGTATWDRLFH